MRKSQEIKEESIILRMRLFHTEALDLEVILLLNGECVFWDQKSISENVESTLCYTNGCYLLKCV